MEGWEGAGRERGDGGWERRGLEMGVLRFGGEGEITRVDGGGRGTDVRPGVPEGVGEGAEVACRCVSRDVQYLAWVDIS